MEALPGIERPGGQPSTYRHLWEGGDIGPAYGVTVGHGMSGAAKEVGHRVVGGAAIGEGGDIGPAYGVTAGHEPRAMARTVL